MSTENIFSPPWEKKTEKCVERVNKICLLYSPLGHFNYNSYMSVSNVSVCLSTFNVSSVIKT